MKKIYVFDLNTISLIKDFVSLASKIEGNIYIVSGKYIINGKSIMGIFSLDLSQDLNCEIEASDEQVKIFEEGLRKLKLF